MTLLYSSPLFLEHKTGSHPESPVRLEHILRRLGDLGLAQRCRRPTWGPAEREQLTALHSPDYVDRLAAIAQRGGGQLDADTVMSERSFDAAALAAGAACHAVQRVLAGEDRNALCLVRPPGHHALPARAMGFCLFGNAAIAARSAIDQQRIDRALIVDWDVHHGNGTQHMFYDDPRVGYFSTHRSPFYPGTGDADETGAGRGLGFTKNLPFAFGTPRREQLSQFEGELERFARHVKPDLVILSAGFDSHAADPIGSLGLETEDFAALSRIVCGIANEHCAGRIVSLLEGGYNPEALADSVAVHLETLLDESSSA